MNAHGLSRLLLLALLALGTPACMTEADDDAASGADALAAARAELKPMAEEARTLAERIARNDAGKDAPFLSPMSVELPSKTFGTWKVAYLIDPVKKRRGYLFLPQEGAPAGAFGLVLAEGESKIVASAAYVPDDAPGAANLVEKILDALPADAAAVGSRPGIQPKGLVDKGVAIAIKLLTGLDGGAVRGAAKGAEAHLATKVSSATWKEFAELAADPKAVARYLAEIATTRLSLKGRKVVMVETNGMESRVDFSIAMAPEHSAKLAQALSARFAGSTSKVALAVRASDENAPVIRWALENDVPVVLGSIGDDAAKSLRDLRPYSVEDARYLVEAARDPKKLALIRNVNTTRVTIELEDVARFPLIEHQQFTPLWAASDEALALRVGADGMFFDWLRRFQFVTTANL